jgi:hypothetical protein
MNNHRDYRYSYEWVNGISCIYDRDRKISEITATGAEAKEIANNMVRALNARDRWLNQTGRVIE